MSRLEENNLTKKLKHNGFRLYLFAFLIAPSGYLLKVMIARELSIEDIGLFYSILGLIWVISTYNDLGLTEALQYFLPKYILKNETDKARSLVWFTRGMQFLTGIVISWGLYLAAPRLAEWYFKTTQAVLVLRMFCVYFLIINLYQVLSSIFIATQQVKRYQWIDCVRMWSIVLITASSIRIWWTLSVYRYTAWRVLGIGIGILASLWGIWKIYPRLHSFSLSWIKQQLRTKERIQYGFRVMLGMSAGTLFGQVNQQLVLVMLWTKAAWIWAYYLSFYGIAGLATGPLTGYLFPLFNELQAKGDQQKIRQLYGYLFMIVLGIGLVWWVATWYLSPRASVFLFGEQFRESWELFRRFAPWVRMIPFSGFLFADMASRGWVKERVWVIVFWLLVCFGATYYSIHHFWLIGSVYGHIAGMLGLLLGAGWVYKMHWFNLSNSVWKKH
jgi:O-antigen/teichoic acid export membrane protein